MFRKFILFAAATITALASIACQDNSISVEFEQNLYVLSSSKDIEIKVLLSEPAPADVDIPMSFSGDAVLGTDYTVNSQKASFKTGSTESIITLTNTSISADKQAVLLINAPKGYEAGAKNQTVVSVDPQEQLICSFVTSKDNVLGSYSAKINVSGAASGSNFTITDNISIPLKVSGDAASYLLFDSDKPSATLKPGEKTASVKFSVKEGVTEGSVVEISIDNEAEPRFIPGDNAKMTLTLQCAGISKNILGTWAFNKIFAQEEVEYFFAEMEDDVDLLPLKNTGFTLTFSEDEEGNIIVTPNDKGDFANFFRTATVTPTTPINFASDGEVIGANTVKECTMFMAEEYDVHTNTYYKLSQANRAFSATKESLGEAVVVFTLLEGNLIVEFRDYDTPPFGEMWWDGTKFDPDMFGFASLFVKQ